MPGTHTELPVLFVGVPLLGAADVKLSCLHKDSSDSFPSGFLPDFPSYLLIPNQAAQGAIALPGQQFPPGTVPAPGGNLVP